MGMFISGYSMTLLVFGSIEVFKNSHCSIGTNRIFVKAVSILSFQYIDILIGRTISNLHHSIITKQTKHYTSQTSFTIA